MVLGMKVIFALDWFDWLLSRGMRDNIVHCGFVSAAWPCADADATLVL
jgi:hypothetical protein